MDLIEQTRIDVQKALDEDVGTGDLTASLVPANARATATIICREAAVICGRPWVDEVLRRVAPAATTTWLVDDGQTCAPGQKIGFCRVSGERAC